MTRKPTAASGQWVIVGLLLLAAVPQDARAAEDCTIAATPLAFGAYDPIAVAPVTASGSITVDCRGNPHAVEIALSPGGSGTFADRRMGTASGTSSLRYNLYLDPSHAQVFGDGTAGTAVAQCTTGTSSGGCIGSNPGGATRRAVRPFHGLLPAGQDADAGDYSDTIQVTLVF